MQQYRRSDFINNMKRLNRTNVTLKYFDIGPNIKTLNADRETCHAESQFGTTAVDSRYSAEPIPTGIKSRNKDSTGIRVDTMNKSVDIFKPKFLSRDSNSDSFRLDLITPKAVHVH